MPIHRAGDVSLLDSGPEVVAEQRHAGANPHEPLAQMLENIQRHHGVRVEVGDVESERRHHREEEERRGRDQPRRDEAREEPRLPQFERGEVGGVAHGCAALVEVGGGHARRILRRLEIHAWGVECLDGPPLCPVLLPLGGLAAAAAGLLGCHGVRAKARVCGSL